MAKKRQSSHPLMGASFSNLRRLERLYGPSEIGFSFYLSALSRVPFSWIDKAIVSKKRKEAEPLNSPIFIIGHWRSGTTHLYNILANAPRFQYVNPYQAGLPADFLSLTKFFEPLLRRKLPKGRFIDQVDVTPTSPQEDEFPLANVMPYSFLNGLYFPKDFKRNFNRGLFFEDLGLKEKEVWKKAVYNFYLKLQIVGPGKTILIKNPPYTARVKMLSEMFPGARFILIYRNPYKIFFSMRNFYKQLLNALALQDQDLQDFDEHIFETFTRMMEVYEADKKALSPRHIVELGFEELQDKPLQALQTVYNGLGLEGFKGDKGLYETYLSSIKDYRKNVYKFAEADLAKVEKHWGKYIRQGGYQRP